MSPLRAGYRGGALCSSHRKPLLRVLAAKIPLLCASLGVGILQLH
jgi:hypothetical protein